jgi:hypothetical protein
MHPCLKDKTKQGILNDRQDASMTGMDLLGCLIDFVGHKCIAFFESIHLLNHLLEAGVVHKMYETPIVEHAWWQETPLAIRTLITWTYSCFSLTKNDFLSNGLVFWFTIATVTIIKITL